MTRWGEIKCPRCAELEAENHLLKSSGIIEVAVRNQNVMEYMRHWEGRAEAAEANMAKQEALMAAGFAEYERRLAKAVEALQKLDVGEGWAAQIARTTLAELKGETDA